MEERTVERVSISDLDDISQDIDTNQYLRTKLDADIECNNKARKETNEGESLP